MNDKMRVRHGRIPSGLVAGFTGIVYYVECLRLKHEKEITQEEFIESVKVTLEEIESDSYSHGSYYDLVKTETVIDESHHKVTLAEFRFRDSY